MYATTGTRINRLRVRSDSHDSLRTRIRLERLLSGVDWRPASLPVNAILCIRKAVDPLPNSISLSATSLQPAYEWQQALTSMLNPLASQAVRPLATAVPPNSEAVLFLDEAELLACLAMDWCRGSLVTNWWGRGILGDRDLAAVVKLWGEKPEYVPAALHHLATINVVVPFVSQLPDATCRQLAQTVARSFGVTALLPLLEVALAQEAFFESFSSIDDGPLPATKMRDAYAPWSALVPETDSSLLSTEQQRFLGVVLMIYRATPQARSRDFTRALARWQSTINRNFSTRSDTEITSPQNAMRPAERREVPIELPATSADQLAIQREAEVSPEICVRETKRERVEKQSDAEVIVEQVVACDAEHTLSTNPIAAPQAEPASSHSEERTQLRDAISDGPADLVALSQSEPVPATTFDLESFEQPFIDFETRLGGLFYLINLGLYLNLYADFTSPLTPGIELNIWDFVALVGRELLEGAESDDPIWAALANLAGRD